MTNNDVYETVIVLLNHTRSDIVDSAKSQDEERIALDVTGALLVSIEEYKKYIIQWPVGHPSFKDESNIDTITSLVDETDCAKLVKRVYDRLEKESAQIMNAYRGINYPYVLEILTLMAETIEHNTDQIVRSCMLPDNDFSPPSDKVKDMV